MATETAAMREGDLARALAFVTDAFGKWRDQGLIGADEYDRIRAYYDEKRGALTLPADDVCWACKGRVGAGEFVPIARHPPARKR